MHGKIARWWVAICLLGLSWLGQPAWAQIEIVDQAGRTVRLEKPASRLYLSEPGDFAVLSMLDPNPARRIVAWNRWRLDPATLEQWRNIDPEAFDDIAQMAINGPQNLNAESLIMHEPDLVVLDHFFGTATHTISQLERAGIPVAILTLEPDLRDAKPADGIEKLAILIGHESRGKEVAKLITEHRDRVVTRVSRLKAEGKPLPTVLMEPHAGTGPCCLSMGRQGSMGDLVRLAGGTLIGSEIVEAMSGVLSPEYVIASDPEIYIGTGGPHLHSRGGLVLGVGVNAQQAATSLWRTVQRVGLAQSRAVRDRRSYGIWHGGLAIVHLELIAKWLHPDEFHDLDPAATQAEINQRFMARPLTGTFWTALSGADQ